MLRNIATELIPSVLRTCIDETPTAVLSTGYVETRSISALSTRPAVNSRARLGQKSVGAKGNIGHFWSSEQLRFDWHGMTSY